MIPISRAISIIERETPVLGSESVRLYGCVGRWLAENVVADSDMPPFDRSQMDGYAMKASDTTVVPIELTIVGESAAGRGWHGKLGRREAIRIMTGAAVPQGADSVQKIELTSESNEVVTIKEPTEKGRYIVRKGAEIRKGATLFRSGEEINEKMVASLAAFGYADVKVAQRPAVSILATGSEIVPINRRPGRDQIRNSNSEMLRALCERAGARSKLIRPSGDDIGKLIRALSKAVSPAREKSISGDRIPEILIITGGVSVGKYDLTKAALDELGAEIFFDKVRLKPGKPAVFGRLGKTLIFGLPGNPVSAAVTFYLFVRKAILQMQKASSTDLPDGHAVLGASVKAAAERDTLLPARIETNREGRLVATPLRWHGSSDFVGFAEADALISLSRGTALKGGEVAKILFL